MKRELAEQFDREVDNYREALLSYARKCDWEAFDSKAGRLFDYVESIEIGELERRFFTIFNLILAVLALAVVVLFSVDFEAHRELFRLKNAFVMTAVAVSGFEIYFYVDYHIYVGVKTRYYKKRRDSFIRDIKRDFRGFAAPQGRSVAWS
jgi:hypothetical protein